MQTYEVTLEGTRANGNRVWRTTTVQADGWHNVRRAVTELAANMAVKLKEATVREKGTQSYMVVSGTTTTAPAVPVVVPTPTPWADGVEGMTRVKWDPIEVRGISHDSVAGDDKQP